MKPVLNGLGRTIVVIASTMLCGSALMFAAIGPGIAQTNAAPLQTAAARLA